MLTRWRKRGLLRQVVANTSWQVGDKVLRLFLGLPVNVWMARYLGPADFGVLSFAIAFVALFTPISDLGLQAVVVRDLVRRQDDRFTIVASALVVRWIGAVVAIATAIAGALWSAEAAATSVLCVVLISLSMLAQAWDVIDYDYQARMRPGRIVAVRAASFLLFSGIKVLLILNGARLEWFALTISAELGMAALLIWLSFNRQAPSFSLAHARTSEMVYLLRTCWPLAISSLSVILYMRIDQVMLGHLMDDRSVGVFSAAVRISEAWYFVPMAILAAVAPVLTRAYTESALDYQRKLLKVMRVMLWLGLAAAIGVTFCAQVLIEFLYGAQFAEAGPVLAVHTWAGVFVGMGVAAGPWYVNNGLLTYKMIQTGVGALANVALNLWLIPRQGALGAAVATIVSYALAGFLVNAVSGRTRPLFWLQVRSLWPR